MAAPSETSGVNMTNEQLPVTGADVTPVSVAPPAVQNTGADVTPVSVAPPAVQYMQNVNLNSKRGRPRKLGIDESMTFAFMPAAVTAAPSASVPPPPAAFVPPPQGPGSSAAGAQLGAASAPPSKRPRGRPPGSTNKPKVPTFGLGLGGSAVSGVAGSSGSGVAGSASPGFTPHVINVETGEDIAEKIVLFCRQCSKSVCIISATGAISTVELSLSAGGKAAYQGRFDILALSGSFTLSETGGRQSRNGTLNVSFARDGSVVGGCVAGHVTAASPVQVIVGTFIAEGQKESGSATLFEASPAPLRVNPGGVNGANNPESQGAPNEPSPLNRSSGAYNNGNPQGYPNMS